MLLVWFFVEDKACRGENQKKNMASRGPRPDQTRHGGGQHPNTKRPTSPSVQSSLGWICGSGCFVTETYKAKMNTLFDAIWNKKRMNERTNSLVFGKRNKKKARKTSNTVCLLVFLANAESLKEKKNRENFFGKRSKSSHL